MKVVDIADEIFNAQREMWTNALSEVGIVLED